MNILETYKLYKIMPQLQEHQLRVAAVAKLICDNFNGPIDTDGVINVCLLHDMGNILKFNFDLFPEKLEPLGLAYWENVKNEVAEKYHTNDEHIATFEIAKEIGLSSSEMEYLEAVGFSKSTINLDNPSFEAKICCYADQRVDPYGIVSIDERLAEGRKRYKDDKNKTYNQNNFQILTADLHTMEKQIFARAKISAEDITNLSVAPIIEDIKHFEI